VQKGGGGDDYLSALKSLGQRHEIDIDWIGAVYDRDELARHYRKASLFVYPTTAAKGEAFPLAPLEAMAQGCPVITSDLRCFDDYIRPNVNAGAFALGEGAVDRLATALAALIADPDVRRDHALQGLATARQFTLGRIADSFVEDFESLRES
jgi:glycosyltransferase involved in cell wall biosynthesis